MTEKHLDREVRDWLDILVCRNSRGSNYDSETSVARCIKNELFGVGWLNSSVIYLAGSGVTLVHWLDQAKQGGITQDRLIGR